MRFEPLPLLVLALSLSGCGAGVENEPTPAGEAPVAEAAARSGSPAGSEPPGDPEPTAGLLPNAVRPQEGLLGGGQPDLDQLAALAEAGYVTIVNLRPEAEGGSGPDEVEALGMRYVSLPISGASDLTAENALAFDEILDEVERPAVVHCASGNRVGALFALRAFHAGGASAEEALAIGIGAGLTGLEAAVREHLESVSFGEAE